MKNGKVKFLCAACLLLAAAGLSRAQIQITGTDPASFRWRTLETAHYRLVYPRGADSLARIYARELELFHPAHAATLGYLPGEKYHKRTPVILHTGMAASNGSVILAPRRIELYPVYDASNPLPLPNEGHLAVHEGRHLAQLQFARDKAFAPFHYLLGEMFAGAMSGVYPNLHLLEGDAVVAETALTESGRGRTHDFLAWYRMSLAEGAGRDWYQWRYGSFNRYTPDHYPLGYMTVAGMRVFYDDPLFMRRYFDSVLRQPLRIGHLQKTVSTQTGKRFRSSWKDIEEAFREQWAEEDSLRAPFTREVPLLKKAPRGYAQYTSLAAGGDGLLAVKATLFDAPVLVRIDAAGREKTLGAFSGSASKLSVAGGRAYWSEIVPSARWSLKQDSRIRFMEGGWKGDLALKGHYYNPAVSPDGMKVAAVEYPQNGGSAIALFLSNGTLMGRRPLPPALQASELCWLADGTLAFAAVSPAGMGLYRTDPQSGALDTLLTPRMVKINHLRSCKGGVTFTSDRNGVNNIYALQEGKLLQLTESRYGATDATWDGDLVYTALSMNGVRPVKTPAQELLLREVRWEEVHRYPVADALSAQEKALAASCPGRVLPEGETPSKPYRKALHLLKFHSWAPLYFDYDDISALSYDSFTRSAHLGFTALFQNDLGTSYGSAGFSYAPSGGVRRPAAHLRWTYTGLAPVIELRADYNERLSYEVQRQYFFKAPANKQPFATAIGLTSFDKPYLSGSATLYFPFHTNIGGWKSGFIPKASITASTDHYSTSVAFYYPKTTDSPLTAARPEVQFDGFTYVLKKESGGITKLGFVCMDFSLRGYVMRPVAQRAIFPRQGFALEAGMRYAEDLEEAIAPTWYCYGYGYLPGVGPGQGLRLSALWQYKTRESTLFPGNFVNTRPRGFADSELTSLLGMYCPSQLKFTADYAIPLLRLDWSGLSPLTYVRNMELIPFFDYSMIRFASGLTLDGESVGETGNLWSAGADVNFQLGNLLWLPYDSKVGVRVAWNGGQTYDLLKTAGMEGLSSLYVGLQFSVDL